MHNISDTENCTGCGACFNACATNAISLTYETTVFYAPVVDAAKCISCGKCLKVCPAQDFYSANEKPDVYAVAAPDAEADKSTSDGAFYVLAKYVLSQGGYVCGVAWNERWEAKHVIVNNETDLEKLRISKYVQATTGDVFRQIRDLLQEGKTVLFSGSPCQNAGLKKYLGKDYDTLITVDHLCHGAPSPKIWQEYLEENYDKSAITAVNFRAKEGNWVGGCGIGAYNTKHGYIEELSTRKQIGVYLEAFLGHLLSNEACLECKYKFIPRPADFTMGDFWSWRNYLPEYSPEHGVSVFLCNNQKAKNLLPKLKSAFKLCRKVNLKQRWEDIEITPQSRRKPERTQFWQEYHKGQLPLRKAMDAALHRHYDIAFAGMFNGPNYGSCLVSYAAQAFLNDMGYSVVMINKKRCSRHNVGNDSLSLRFAHKYFYITKIYETKDNMAELNNIADAFIVGSDTNWWWQDVLESGYYYWLDFVQSDKRKISFSTSFAHEVPDIPREEYPKLRYLYSRFDALSTREPSGVTNLKERFGVKEATCIIDPTLIADPKIFEDVAKESARKDEGYLFAYILDPSPQKDAAIRKLAERLNLQVRAVPGMLVDSCSELYNEKQAEIVDFVYLAAHASYVVTDSFHGTCFSVIFEHPFISFVNNWRGSARYQVFRDMGFSDRLIPLDRLPNIPDDSLLSTPDFSKARAYRQQEREKAIAWLRESMGKEHVITKEDLLYDFLTTKEIPKPKPPFKQRLKGYIHRKAPRRVILLLKECRCLYRALRKPFK